MRISVYITSYNQKEYLREAIESVLNQTLKPMEIIIVDDCSSDGSQELIGAYTNQHPGWIKPILNTSNHGISYCRTLAINTATGDYLSWVDGDDAFLPQKLEIEANLLKDSEFQIAFSNYYFAQDDLTNIIRVWAYDFSTFPARGKMFKEVLIKSFPWGSLYRSELIELDLLRNTTLYDENLEIYEDYDLRIRLSEIANITYTHEPLSIYRLHGNGLSRTKLIKHYESYKYIFGKYQKQIEYLPAEEKKYVQAKLEKLLGALDPSAEPKSRSYKISLKRKIQLKLISIINKL